MPQLIHRALRGKVILQILQDRVRTALPGLFHGRSQLLAVMLAMDVQKLSADLAQLGNCLLYTSSCSETGPDPG